MRYYGQFVSNDNKVYDVNIGATTGDYVDLDFTNKAFVQRWDSDELFKPLKLSSGTLSISTDRFMFDLFSATSQSIPVTIKEGATVIFAGYITPAAWQQPFPDHEIDFEIEVEDYLCSLEKKKYLTSDGRKIRSFYDLFLLLLKGTGSAPIFDGGGYNALYVHDFSNMTIKDLYISDQNWFDEDNEAMTYKEIFDNLLRYMGLTMFAIGEDLYCVDYNLLRKGSTAFRKYTRSGESTVTISNTAKLQDYEIQSGVKLSISDVYDKVTIRSSLYNFNDYLERINDESLIYADGELFIKRTVDTTVYSGRSVRHDGYTLNPDLPKFTPTTFQQGRCVSFLEGAAWHKDDAAKSRRDWSTYLGYRNNKYNYTTPIATVKKSCSAAFGHGFFCISANWYLQDYDSPIPRDNAKQRGGSEANCYFRCQLKVGDYYCSASLSADKTTVVAVWGKTPATIVIPMANEKSDMMCVNTWLSTLEVDGYADQVPDLKGFVIPTPSWLLTGDIEFKIMSCSGASTIMWQFLRSISLEFSYPVDRSQDGEKSIKELKDSDTVYEGLIDEYNYSEMEEITLKVATNTAKGLSFASVLYKDELGAYQFVSGMYNHGIGRPNTQELTLLESYIRQYSEPRKLTEMTVWGYPTMLHVLRDSNYVTIPDGSKFAYKLDIKFKDDISYDVLHVVDCMEIDYANGVTNINLIEKG